MHRALILFACCLLARASRYSTPPSCPLDHINHDPNYGLIQTYNVEDEYGCMELCDDSSVCVGYNVELPDIVCELSEGAADGDPHGLDMLTRDGWTYWEKQGLSSNMTCASNSLYGRKQKELVSVGTFTQLVTRGDWAWWGKDALDAQDRSYLVTTWSNANQLTEYPTETDFIASTNSIVHFISPVAMSLQYVVYGRKFWYREANYRRVIAWDLDRDVVAGHINMDSLPGSQVGPVNDECDYAALTYAGLDIEVDESGIWFVWGRPRHDCFLSISKVDHINYRILRTWDINGVYHTAVSNVFIVDGIAYGIESQNAVPTYIKFQFNTRNNSIFTFTDDVAKTVTFPNTGSQTAQVHYNPKDGRLYRTSWARHGYIDLTLKNIP